MARNGSGTQATPNTFVAGTSITAADHNENWTDVAAEITNSLALDGQSTMTGQFKASNGTLAAPAVAFGSDGDTGRYRKAANTIADVCGGSEVVEISSTGVSVTGSVSATGSVLAPAGTVAAPAVSFSSDTDSGLYNIGANNLGIGVAGAKVLDIGTAGLGITGTLQSSGALTVTSGGATITAGGLTVTAGGLTVTAGSVSLPAGSVALAALASSVGSQIFISAQTASNSTSLAFTGLSSTYRSYLFIIDNMLPASDDNSFKMEVSDDNGSNYKTSSYVCSGNATDSSPANSAFLRTDSIQLSAVAGSTTAVYNGSGYGWSGTVRLFNPASTTSRKIAICEGYYPRSNAGSVGVSIKSGGYWNGGNGAITAVRFLFNASNITSGKISMYGILDS